LTDEKIAIIIYFSKVPVYAIILDSGEDKADDVVVYGGIVDFGFQEKNRWMVKKKKFKKESFVKQKYIKLYS